MRALRTSSCLKRTPILLAAAVMCMAMCACGQSRPRTEQASGQVLVNERPIANAVVIFHPVNANADAVRPTGRTDEQGRFKLSTNKDGDGAPAGEYKVTITAYQSIENRNEDSRIVNYLPARYGQPETSNLTVTIGKGKNEIEPFRLDAR